MLLTGDSASGRDAWTSFEAVAEAIPHIAWLADAKGSTDYFNTLGTDYTGLPREVNYGWGWLDLVHPADAERARVGWAHASSTATAFELIYRLRGRDGEFRWHVFRALPIRGDDGEVQRWIGTADELTSQHDASDQARVETQVAQLRTMLETFQPVAGAAAEPARLPRRPNACARCRPTRPRRPPQPARPPCPRRPPRRPGPPRRPPPTWRRRWGPGSSPSHASWPPATPTWRSPDFSACRCGRSRPPARVCGAGPGWRAAPQSSASRVKPGSSTRAPRRRRRIDGADGTRPPAPGTVPPCDRGRGEITCQQGVVSTRLS